MNRDPLPGSDEARNDALRKSPLASWCREQGFTLEWKASPESSYAVSWEDAETGLRETELVSTLAGVLPFVEAQIARSPSARPREWYLFWAIADRRPGSDSWCRWRRWVIVVVVEGSRRLPSPGFRSDPAPYPSAEACVAASALLGLEFGARLSLSAVITGPPGKVLARLPTRECTPAAVEELIIDCVRGRTTAALSDTKELAKHLEFITNLARDEGESALERLLSDGRLEWGTEVDPSGEERRYLCVAGEVPGQRVP